MVEFKTCGHHVEIEHSGQTLFKSSVQIDEV